MRRINRYAVVAAGSVALALALYLLSALPECSGPGQHCARPADARGAAMSGRTEISPDVSLARLSGQSQAAVRGVNTMLLDLERNETRKIANAIDALEHSIPAIGDAFGDDDAYTLLARAALGTLYDVYDSHTTEADREAHKAF